MSDDELIPDLFDLDDFEEDVAEIEVEIEPVDPDDDSPPSNISSVSQVGQSRTGSQPSSVLSGSQPSQPSQPASRTGAHKADPMIGVRLKDTYELVAKIGEGGMGNVYSAIQYPLKRQVAVKVLKPSENNPEGEHYFMREVQAINMLRHPNIITIVDYGKEADGMLYLVMEHLPGDTLKRIIKKDFPLDPKRLCTILIQLLSALEQAHKSQIVHCDLKPANIMVESVAGQDDFIKVLDFGIAKVKGPAMEVGPYTQAGNIVGTFDYMSPEQIMRKPDLDGRADIWSVGVIMYEMLTRKRLFHDRDAVSIIGRVMQMVIPPPSEMVPDVPIPKILEKICLKALERNVSKRYQSAGEMRAELQDALNKLDGRAGAGAYRPGSDHTDSTSGSHSSSALAGSGLIQGGSGPLSQPAPRSDNTSRTGLSSIFSRSGGGNLGDSQRIAANLAMGTSILDQTFSVDELEGSLIGERRKVAVLCIQQRARRSEGIDPEELARRSAVEAKIIREVVNHFEGELDSNLGGTYTILFGARKTRIGDNVRAVQCALALQERFRFLEQGADHIGIGLVYGEVFISDRKGGNAYGEAIDRAVEIARSVREGRVFADDALMEVTREQVRFDAPRHIAGQSANEILSISNLNASAKEEDVDEAGIYVPRPALFDELLRRASATKGGHGGGIGILGDLGTGKSVLLERFVAQLSETGWQSFIVKGEGLGRNQNLPFARAWIRQIARTYKDPHTLIRKASEAIGLNRNIDGVLQVYMSDEGRPEPGFETPWTDATGFANFTAALLYRMIRFAMKSGPVLLAVDDVDSQDTFAMSFLDGLLAGVQKLPVLVAVTRRIESHVLDHGLPGNVEVLQIGGFNEGEARQLIGQMLGYTPPPEVVAEIYQRTNGNPMFLREFVRALRKRGGDRIMDASQLSGAGIPFNLQELLGARIDALPEQLRHLIAIASVLGESFREDFFFQITPGHLDPQGGLHDLVALNVLQAEYDDFQRVHVHFNPRALRRVLYERLPKSTRVQIHTGIIEFLEQAQDWAAVDPLEYPAMVAFHYRAVEGWEGAAFYLLQAGELLLDLYDYAGAITQFEEALATFDKANVDPVQETRLRTLWRLLVALRESGRIEDAQRVLDRLPPLDQIGGWLRLDLLYEKGMVEMEAGGIQQSLQDLAEVKDVSAQYNDPKREIKALLALAQLFEKENQLPRAAGLLMEVSKKVEGLGDLNLQDPDDRKLVWTAYNQLGTLFIRQKDYQRAQQFLATAFEQARNIEDFRGLVRVFSNLGALSLSVRDVKRAMQHFESAVQCARGVGDLLNQSRILTNLGITAMEANDLEASKDYFKQARTLAEEIGWYEGLAELSLHIKRLQKAMG
jgi:serine/threonine protein kinase/tetratricopeptide (TPR) repeat protein